MAAIPEANQSLKERARRALLDNPEVEGQPTGDFHLEGDPAGDPAGDPMRYPELIDQRLRAIRLVREMEPKRACCGERVRALARSLVEVPGDSVHYSAVLERLREAHQEWLELEELLWAANDIIRATQWLVDLLADPGGRSESNMDGAGLAGHDRQW